MELIKSAGHRTRLSEIVYIAFNLLLPVALFVLTAVVKIPWVAVALLLLSKWRIFAVRPRYWIVHLKSNLVDTIVGLSYVFLLTTKLDIAVQIILIALYAAWLIYLKPKSRRHFMAMQAGIGQFLGLLAVFSLSYQIDVTLVIILSWLVGYASARHIATAYEEENLEMIAIVWGLLIAEFAWFAYHWTLAYQLAIGINIPQIAALITVLGFAAYDMYDNQKHVRFNPLRMRLTLGVTAVLVVIILVFARWNVSV